MYHRNQHLYKLEGTAQQVSFRTEPGTRSESDGKTQINGPLQERQVFYWKYMEAPSESKTKSPFTQMEIQFLQTEQKEQQQETKC